MKDSQVIAIDKLESPLKIADRWVPNEDEKRNLEVSTNVLGESKEMTEPASANTSSLDRTGAQSKTSKGMSSTDCHTKTGLIGSS